MTHRINPPGRTGEDEGSALVLALVFAVVVGSIAGALLAATSLERKSAAVQTGIAHTLAALEAIVDNVLVELSRNEWSEVLAGITTSNWRPFGSSELAPWNESIDLRAATTEAQTIASATWRIGPDTPRWRVFAAGSLNDLIRDGLPVPPRYVIAWVADDPGDGDGDPTRDSNGRILVRGEVRGPAGERRTVQVLIGRPADTSESERKPGVPGGTDEGSAPGLARFLRHSAAGSVGEPGRQLDILGWRFER